MIYPSDIEQRFERRWAESRRTAWRCLTELQVAPNPLAAAGSQADEPYGEAAKGVTSEDRGSWKRSVCPEPASQSDLIINVCAGSSPPYA
jgi:hypothetical protein